MLSTSPPQVRSHAKGRLLSSEGGRSSDFWWAILQCIWAGSGRGATGGSKKGQRNQFTLAADDAVSGSAMGIDRAS